MRRFSGNILLVLLSSALCFVGIEIVLRLVDLSPARWSDRPTIFYFPKDNGDKRDQEYALEKPTNTFRIAIIGDSFTYGEKVQLDDTLPKRLERLLNLNSSAERVEVMNFGVPGYSTRREAILLKEALRYNVDFVILQITLNDPELSPKSAQDLLNTSWKDTEQSWLFQHSRAYAFIRSRLHNSQTHKDYIRYFEDLFESKKTLQNFRAGLDDFKKMTSRRNIPFAAILFPLFSHPLTDTEYPFGKLHQKVMAELAARAIPGLDLFPFYRDIPYERLQVEPGNDRHPNEIAYRLAAEAIYRWLPAVSNLPQNVFAARTSLDRAPTEQMAKGNLAPASQINSQETNGGQSAAEAAE